MANWFTCKISYLYQAENGSIIKKSEQYLLNAMSFTEAEARLATLLESLIPEYNLLACGKAKLADAIFFEDAEDWYKVKIAYVTFDEDSGKEKKITEFYLICANSVKDAYQKMEEYMSGSVVEWEIPAITKTNILEVFPYDGDAIEDEGQNFGSVAAAQGGEELKEEEEEEGPDTADQGEEIVEEEVQE